MSSTPAASLPRPGPRRTRPGPVLALLALVLVLHGLLLGALPRERLPSPRPGPLPAPAVWTRAVPAAPPPQAAPAMPEPRQQAEREAAATLQRPQRMADAPAATEAAAPATTSAATTSAPPAVPMAPSSSLAPASDAATKVAPTAAHDALPHAATDAATDADGDEPQTAARGGSAPPLYATRLPGPAQLRFQLRRGAQRGQALMEWQPGGDDRYTMSFDASAGGRPVFEQRSTGRSGPHGLSPERFQDKRRGRSAQHATFDADAQRIAFSGGRAPDLPLWAGAQDRLGWIVQLAGIVAAAAQPPQEVRLYVVGARGGAGPWTFFAHGIDEVATPLGPVQALHYERAPAVLRDQRIEAWLDPARGFWPVKLRFTPVLGGAPLELLLEEEPRKP